MEHTRKMGVFEVVNEKERYDNGCKLLKLKWCGQDEGRENAVRDWSVGRSKRAKDRDEQLGPEDVFSPMPPSEGLKMLVSHNDDRTRRWKPRRRSV